MHALRPSDVPRCLMNHDPTHEIFSRFISFFLFSLSSKIHIKFISHKKIIKIIIKLFYIITDFMWFLENLIFLFATFHLFFFFACTLNSLKRLLCIKLFLKKLYMIQWCFLIYGDFLFVFCLMIWLYFSVFSFIFILKIIKKIVLIV